MDSLDREKYLYVEEELAHPWGTEWERMSVRQGWTLPHQRFLASVTRREAVASYNLPLVPGEGVTEFPLLLAKDKDTRLTGEANFLHLPVFTEQYGVIRRLAAAIFPAALGFGHHSLALLDGGLVPFDLEAVFPGPQLGLAEPGVLRNVDGLGKRLRERWYRHCDGGKQSHTADK